ncbi:MAG TPA: phytoene/squalene synthase family protein [Bryobacteraceae bacterium]|jgi:phytoene synthase|nr:phytoene/squalene synthase family protein [Bryobacteraceae bacterium]
MTDLAQSYDYCRRVARSRAKNFYYSFLLLSAHQRKSMCAIYAFMRYCDDLSDEPGANRAAIDVWRQEMEEALQGRFSQHPVWPAFHDTVQRFAIPHEYFREMIGGVASDLEPREVQTFDELYRYCYQVASVVGLTILHIFGFDTPAALPLAEKCGVAFQLTNILRDIHEDAGLGRVYLPAEDLRRFGVTSEDLRAGNRNESFLRLMRFEAVRARAYYDESLPLLDLVERRSRPSLWALITIYSRLLERIEAANFDVFSRRVRLSSLEKSWILVKALVSGRSQGAERAAAIR